MTTTHERVNGTATAPPAPHRPSRAERLAADAAARAEADRIRDEAKRDRARRDEEWAAEREQLRQDRKRTRKTSSATARSERVTAWQARLQKWWHAFVLVGAIVGVNVVAVVGQVTAFSASTEANGFGWSPLQAIATAAVIETIAIYVGWHAHTALIEGDSVMRLRVTSYAIALGVGALNYYHYAPDWRFDDQAVMFGGASVLSPWLWAMHSRHQHRQALREQGLIDPRAPKFSALRWLLWRSETWTALRWAVRYGEQSPVASILAVQAEETTAETSVLLDRTRDEVTAAQAALIRAQSAALAVLDEVADETRTETENETTHEVEIKVSPEPAESPVDLPAEGGDETPNETEIETPDETRATDAMWRHWKTSVEVERRIPTGAELAVAGNCSPQYGAKKAREWKAEMDGRIRRALLPGKKA
ncbi:hypothetical protein ACIBQX_18615 [Nonomuraea sp. NPDC049714]|uniref:hypothetical protein n=1 Tax=Nonomuraea sp. NPDC049714 TaxID=3364357 RepID=UPI00379B4662